MIVPKEVILDLLPVYLAGEVSPATRAWIEDYLARDPELAERVRRERTEIANGVPLPPVRPELELRALHRTRSIMARLRWLFGFALAFTLIPFSLEIDFQPLRIRLLLLDYPAVLLPCLLIGVSCWFAYFRLRRRLRL